MVPRAAAIVLISILGIGNLAVCAGWEATPAQRMACCENEARCPMHAAAPESARAITQAEADTCCAAASDRTQAPLSGSAFVSLHAASTPAPAPVAIAPAVMAVDRWRARGPAPRSPVPRHLLFSVLLV